MVLKKVGEHYVTVDINGTQRIAQNISDDTNFDITESFNLDISIQGASNINQIISSDFSKNVYPDFNPGVYVNNNYEGDALDIGQGDNIDVSITPSSSVSKVERLTDDSNFSLSNYTNPVYLEIYGDDNNVDAQVNIQGKWIYGSGTTRVPVYGLTDSEVDLFIAGNGTSWCDVFTIDLTFSVDSTSKR